jgi:putative addiction module component (TIGR02574 family)
MLWCMGRSFAQIADEALQLPQDEQLRLVRTLLEKHEASGDTGVEAAWEEEIERRIQMLDSGLAKGRPFAEVLREIDDRLKG